MNNFNNLDTILNNGQQFFKNNILQLLLYYNSLLLIGFNDADLTNVLVNTNNHKDKNTIKKRYHYTLKYILDFMKSDLSNPNNKLIIKLNKIHNVAKNISISKDNNSNIFNNEQYTKVMLSFIIAIIPIYYEYGYIDFMFDYVIMWEYLYAKLSNSNNFSYIFHNTYNLNISNKNFTINYINYILNNISPYYNSLLKQNFYSNQLNNCIIVSNLYIETFPLSKYILYYVLRFVVDYDFDSNKYHFLHDYANKFIFPFMIFNKKLLYLVDSFYYYFIKYFILHNYFLNKLLFFLFYFNFI